MAKNWIAGAIKHEGALTKKAKKAGESTSEFAAEHEHDKGKTGKQARLAQTLAHLRPKGPSTDDAAAALARRKRKD